MTIQYQKIASNLALQIRAYSSWFLLPDSWIGSFHERECVFIHIPKTGGSSVSLSFFGAQVGHKKYMDYYMENPWSTKKYFKFCFVRNPWDRLVSAYYFLKSGGLNSEDALWFDKNLFKYNSFTDFVMCWVNEENVRSRVHFIPQCSFIQDLHGNIKVDYIGRFESLDRDVSFLKQKLDCPVSIQHANESKKRCYKEEYNDDTRNIVEEVYKRDIEMFNYKF